MKFVAIRDLSGFRPVDDRGRDLMGKVKFGKQVVIEVKQARNVKELRLYWALMHLIFPNQSTWPTEEDLSDAIKCAVGHCTETKLKDGRLMVRPKSISFAKSEQAEWRAFLDRVMTLITTKILPGVTKEDLKRELEEITGATKTR